MSVSKVRLTVLKRQDPKDIFDEYPVAEQDWFVPCKIYEDGEEFIIDERLAMPEKFCSSAWRAISPTIRTLAFGGNLRPGAPDATRRSTCIRPRPAPCLFCRCS